MVVSFHLLQYLQEVNRTFSPFWIFAFVTMRYCYDNNSRSSFRAEADGLFGLGQETAIGVSNTSSEILWSSFSTASRYFRKSSSSLNMFKLPHYALSCSYKSSFPLMLISSAFSLLDCEQSHSLPHNHKPNLCDVWNDYDG